MALQSVSEETPTGIIARPIAGVRLRADRWDIFLCAGVAMLVIGVGLLVGSIAGVIAGIGSALSLCGLLFIVGSLWGARNVVGETD